MVKAVFNGKESKDCVVVEGNQYFPPSSIKQEYFKDSVNTTVCGWKGTAKYKTVVVDGKEAVDGCWYYPEPKAAANNIKGYYAFWKGVKVEK